MLGESPIVEGVFRIAQVAQVIVDVAARELDRAFDYAVPVGMDVAVGHCVAVDFGNRPAVGYVVGLSQTSPFERLKPLSAVLGGPFFDAEASRVAEWISQEYVCPLSEAVRLFTPPGATPKAVRSLADDGSVTWNLKRPGVGPVDDRWVSLIEGSLYEPSRRATTQRAILDALVAGPVRVAELTADLGSVGSALVALAKAEAIEITSLRRTRGHAMALKSAPRHANLTDGQQAALDAIMGSLDGRPGVIALDGVTGSGKTEVYLRAIEHVISLGRTACVLVPEISLTPQTVGRFRSRFGEDVAVLHSRLTPGERLDQWDRVADGLAHVVVGARSALFAPLGNLGIVVIDEEHESSYKQESAPRYHARDVAVRLCEEKGATLVLGSASLSMETRLRGEEGAWRKVELPARVSGRALPPVTVVDLAAVFASGNRSMLSGELCSALGAVRESAEKAVLFLNRRGFASFLLCRECGHVPSCDSCSTSMTYHEVGSRLSCHHCAAVRAVPPVCPECGSPYLRQFGAGTQRVEAELESAFPGWPVVRMDADTTTGRGAHERLLAAFESERSAVLLGTQMIAKGLDYPAVTLVGVISADVTLNLPDFRAGERAYQLLEQVAGRAGRGDVQGRVIVQTYWPEHPAVRAAAAHDPRLFYEAESRTRLALGYPPYGRLVNVLVRGRDSSSVSRHAGESADALLRALPAGWTVLGPSPAPLSRVKGVWRWHVLVKGPRDAAVGEIVSSALKPVRQTKDVVTVLDVDPLSLM